MEDMERYLLLKRRVVEAGGIIGLLPGSNEFYKIFVPSIKV